jgi:hypothetical protein
MGKLEPLLPDTLERVTLARQHLGLTAKQLAELLGDGAAAALERLHASTQLRLHVHFARELRDLLKKRGVYAKWRTEVERREAEAFSAWLASMRGGAGS